jgi:glycosyltransferase involved in cell wall biosynthesis
LSGVGEFKPMRVAVVGYPLLARRQWKLYTRLAPRHDVHLLTPHNWPTAHDEDHPTGEEPFTLHRHRSAFNGRMNRYLVPGVARTLSRVDPDAVLTHGEPWQLQTLFTELAAEWTGVPHAVFSWENLDRVPGRRVQRLIERAVLRGVDGVIPGSDQAADRLRRRGYGGPMTVAPETGVDTEEFGPRDSSPEMRDRFDLPGGPVVLYTGRMVVEKGVELLLDTVPDVSAAVPDVQYLLVGEGDLADDLRERIAGEGLDDRVTLVTDRQPYELMPDVHSLASVFVYPSYTTETWAEQFGYAPAEAMSCGRPVVTTECGSLPYVVGDGGVVCPERDAAALADGIVDLLGDDDRRERLGRRARERVREEFSIEQVARKHEAMLREIV